MLSPGNSETREVSVFTGQCPHILKKHRDEELRVLERLREEVNHKRCPKCGHRHRNTNVYCSPACRERSRLGL